MVFARAAVRGLRVAKAPSPSAARRGFKTSSAQFSSPYHYPEGPLSNLPFNPRKKWFPVGYWSVMAAGFGLPFAIAVWQTKKNK